MAVNLQTAAGPARNPSPDAPGRPNGPEADTATPPILQAALDYAETTGHRVFFLSGSKGPLRGSHGHLDATADPDGIRRLFQQHPGGVAIGAPVPGGEFVLDVDPRSGGGRSLDQLIREHGP